MKKIILLSVLVSALTSAHASDRLFNKLEKLYKKAPEKCLQKSKEQIKKHPDRPASYYFAAIIFLDKAEHAKNSRALCLHLNSSLRYVKGFESKAGEELKEAVSWTEVIESIREEASKLMQGQMKLDDEQLLQKLRTRLLEIPGLEDVASVEIEMNEQKSSDELALKKPEIKRTDVRTFYGMPEGTEFIAPIDEAKERELLVMINHERRKLGMDTLLWQEDLARASRYHAFDLASQNYFDHNTYDRDGDQLVEVGKTFKRIRKFYSATHVNSENIAAGNQEVEATYQQWFTSTGHYKNMFNPGSRYAGIGFMYDPNSDYKYYWVFCSAE